MAYSIQTSTLYTNTPFPQIGGQLGCISGYISNPDSANPASVIIYGVNKTGKISRSIAANGYLIFRSLEFEYIINTSNINLEIVYSQDTNFLLEESQSIVNIGTTVDINISGISGSVTIPVSGNVNITNTSLNVAGTVNIGNTANINISSISSGVTIPISGNVNVTNSSLTVTGTVDIGNTTNINISSISSGVTIPISGSVNVTNSSLTVTGTVDIGNTTNINISSISSGVTIPISGSVDITNSSLTVSGTVNIGNNITISGNVNALTIDISGSITLPTDLGKLSLNLQENQTSGTNSLVYNPWNFSTGTTYAARTSFGNATFCNVQQNGAYGYPTFYFQLYNPTSSTQNVNFTINLYDRLPSNPSNTPINSFAYSYSGLAAGAYVWIGVTPNLFWSYGSLVVIPSIQTGTTGSTAGVTIPNVANNIDSHYWNGTYWDTADYGFVGFWSWTNTAPSSTPVQVTTPVHLASGTPANSGKVTANSQLTVPSGKKWTITAVHMALVGASTGGAQAWVYINRSGDNFQSNPSPPPSYEAGEQLAFYNNTSLPSGTNAYASGSVATGNGVAYANYTTQEWSGYPVLYAGDMIGISFLAGTGSATIWYVESDV